MAQVQIALLIAKDCTSVHSYGKKEERKKEELGMHGDQEAQGPWGMIFRWVRPQISSRRLVCLGLDICGVKRWEEMLLRTPSIAARAFNDGERLWAAAQPERLVRLWTIKEALAKALGCGFAGLAYHEIAIEFVPDGLLIQLPATVPSAIPGEQKIADIHWQLLCFAEQALLGALVLAWVDNKRQHTVGCIPETHEIVLEFRPVTAGPSGARREKRMAERLAARQAVYGAASHLSRLYTHQLLTVGQAPGGRPVLQISERDLVTTDDRMCLSLSHCSDWAAAALGGEGTSCEPGS